MRLTLLLAALAPTFRPSTLSPLVSLALRRLTRRVSSAALLLLLPLPPTTLRSAWKSRLSDMNC